MIWATILTVLYLLAAGRAVRATMRAMRRGQQVDPMDVIWATAADVGAATLLALASGAMLS